MSQTVLMMTPKSIISGPVSSSAWTDTSNCLPGALSFLPQRLAYSQMPAPKLFPQTAFSSLQSPLKYYLLKGVPWPHYLKEPPTLLVLSSYCLQILTTIWKLTYLDVGSFVQPKHSVLFITMSSAQRRALVLQILAEWKNQHAMVIGTQ